MAKDRHNSSKRAYAGVLRILPPLKATAFCAEKGRAEMLERKVLHSWKDISNYTGRGVRTIQRYEVQLGFPIHRPAGKSRSAVFAFSDEVDAWLNNAPMAATIPAVVPLHRLTADQIRGRREWLGVAANAKRSRESARATYALCMLHKQRVREVTERLKALRLRLLDQRMAIGALTVNRPSSAEASK